MAANLVKMMGYPQVGPNDPNSYSAPYGCRPYLRDTVQAGPTPFKWMRLFFTWSFVQPSAPPYADSDVGGAFNFYNTDGQAQTWFRWFDDVVAACNADGIFVNLCLSQYHPAWANPGSPAVEPGTENDPNHGPKPRSQRLPADVSAGGYWAKWVTYIYNRYHAVNYQGVYNPVGPSSTTSYWGNPKSAWIGAFEFCNEPNIFSWNGHDPAHCVVANMFQTVDSILNFWGPACAVLGPATADTAGSTYTNGMANVIEFETFTNSVLDTLQNWRPTNYFAWSHHNYRDMRDSTDSPTTANLTRIKKVGTALQNKNWRGGGDRNIWLTEGGYRLPTDGNFTSAERTKQVNAIASTWKDLKGYANAVAFSQYLLNNDPRDNYWSGLTTIGSYNAQNNFVPGSHLPAWDTFANRT
jgi:hypothetical protein